MFSHYSLSIKGTHHENQDVSGSVAHGNTELFWVIDGATAESQNGVGPADYAADLSRALAHSAVMALTEHFDYDRLDLKGLLHLAIMNVQSRTSAQAGYSATVALAMVTQEDEATTVDGLVLGDASVALASRDGAVRQYLHDNRLDLVKFHNREIIDRVGRQAFEDSVRNTDHGFWVAASDPEAAFQARVFDDTLQEGDVITLCTDGVTDLIRLTELATLDLKPSAQRSAVQDAFRAASDQGLKVDDTTITQVFAAA